MEFKEAPKEIKTKVKMEFKEAPKEIKTKVKINIFEYKKKFQQIETKRRIVKFFSSQLGEKSRGNSFFQRICQHIADSRPLLSWFRDSPKGIKIGEMMKLETEKQRCDIECVPGWDNTFWPLE
eukprot:GFUD01082735.1.p1 GENE.GFUD01082735.1~~GFUD01082735.1.p1  ORF type:complete len:130 (+),score=36.29 GFUD01082735.1:22-390(+)